MRPEFWDKFIALPRGAVLPAALQDAGRLAAALGSGAPPMVEATVGLDAVPDLLESMRAGASRATKILVDPWA